MTKGQKPLASEVLRQLLARTDFSAAALARAAGFKTPSGLQNYTDDKERTAFPIEVAQRFAQALIGKGNPLIEVGDLVRLLGVEVPEGSDPDPSYYALLGIQSPGADAEAQAWLRDVLTQTGLRQKDFAQAIGLSEDAVSRILSGQRNLRLAEALHIAKALDVPSPSTGNPLAPDTGSMDGSHVRLIEARVAAGFPSARAASAHHGWTESSYRSHENGARAIKRASAIEYGRAFDVSADWILSGTGEPPVPAEPISAPASNGVASMTEIGPGQYRLWVDKVVPRAVALQILGLLPDE